MFEFWYDWGLSGRPCIVLTEGLFTMKDDSPDDRRSTGSYHSFGSIVGGTVARTSTWARTVFVLK